MGTCSGLLRPTESSHRPAEGNQAYTMWLKLLKYKESLIPDGIGYPGKVAGRGWLYIYSILTHF